MLAVVHQVVGWLVFRTQLLFSLFTRLFGKYDLAVWGGIFFPLFLLRPVLTLGVGLADYGSLEPLRSLQIVLGLLLLIPVAYTLRGEGDLLLLEREMGDPEMRMRTP